MPSTVCQGASCSRLSTVLQLGIRSSVDLLHALAGDEAQARVAGGRDEIEAALVHQGDHLVGGAGGLDVDLAAGLLLEVGDPVVGLVGFAALDVARPGDDIDLPLAFSDRCHGAPGEGGLDGHRRDANKR